MSLLFVSAMIISPSPLSAATLFWSEVKTPSATGWQLVPGIRLDFFLVAQNGDSMFAYDNTGHKLYKSTDEGLSWTTDGVGNGLEGDIDGSGVEDANDDVVAVAISPDFEVDSTVVAAIKGKVFRSTNGGQSFFEVGLNVGGLIGDGSVITSIDVATWYKGGIAILVGHSDGAQGGGICIFTSLNLLWDDLQVGDWNTDGIVETPCDVLAVAFSPNHKTDSAMIAVVTNNVAGAFYTQVTTKAGDDAWASDLSNGTIFTQQAATAVITFPDDFDWSILNRCIVGTTGTSIDDAYLVTGDISAGAITVNDLNVNGTSIETNVQSVNIKGSGFTNGASVTLVGQVGLSEIRISRNFAASTSSWYSSSKSLPGSTNVRVAWSPSSYTAYAINSGINSALSRSTDNGNSWNQFALISISASANIAFIDLKVIDSSILYLLIRDDADASGTINTGDYSMLFRTINGGTSWEQILGYRSVGTEALTCLAFSPRFATDRTLFITQNDKTIWKSTNNGDTFSKYIAPLDVTAIGVVNNTTFYTGHVNTFYKNGRSSVALLGGDTAVSIVTAPSGAIFVGTDDGTVLVSTDDGKNFSSLGQDQALGSGADVTVTLDPNYSSNRTIYAGSSNVTKGVQRWVLNSSNSWKKMDDDSNNLACVGMAVTEYGAFYAGNNTVERGIRRSVSFAPDKSFDEFESMTDGLPAFAKTEKIAVISGSTMAYAIVSNVAPGGFGYPYRLLVFEDTMAVVPELTSPADKEVISGDILLAWQGIESSVTPKYKYQISRDAVFANIVVNRVTEGTAATVKGLTAGVQYWWRIFVEAGEPLRSKESEARAFTVRPLPIIVQSPVPGAKNMQLKPMFSWEPTEGAESYTLELADNPEFKNAAVQSGITSTVWAWGEDLEYSTNYFWRVRAILDKGASEFSGRWTESTFTTDTRVIQPGPKVEVVEPEPATSAEISLPQLEIRMPPNPPAVQVVPLYIWVITGLVFVLFIVIILFVITTSRRKLF
ncbi:hypothetical protein ACFLXC_05770 [Chloroflexota bacterium]